MISRLRLYRDALRAAGARLEAQRDLAARFPSAQLDESVQVVSPHLLELGANVLVQSWVLLHCGGLAWSEGRGSIRIGADSTISPNCVLFGAGGIAAGERFGCGPGSMIFSSRDRFEIGGSDDHEGVFEPVTIGDDVLLFAGCIIGPGVTLGDGAVVGANSLVLSDVPARTLVAGSPARVLRELPDRRPTATPGWASGGAPGPSA